MKRLSPFVMLVLVCAAVPAPAGADKPADTKAALQLLQDYIGGWKGNGQSDKEAGSIWKESADWSWRFKGKDAYFSVDLANSKLFKKGELRYLPAKEAYQLTLTDVNDKQKVFEGELKRSYLVLERTDPDTEEGEQVKINTAGEGLRLIVAYSVRRPERTQFTRQMLVSYTKEGESFGSSAGKRPECVVTGGLGTMAVSFNGMTYYVCCSGCRDAFNENPAKVIAEYLARKKAGR